MRHHDIEIEFDRGYGSGIVRSGTLKFSIDAPSLVDAANIVKAWMVAAFQGEEFRERSFKSTAYDIKTFDERKADATVPS